MKKTFTFILLPFLFLCYYIKTQKLYAQSMLGAEITYNYGTDDSLNVTLTSYSYCDGNLHPAPLVRVTDNNITENLLLDLNSSEDITPLCTELESKCKNPASAFPYGIIRNIYKGKVYRGNFSCEITISWNGGKRASNITNLAAGQDLYIEAKVIHCRNNTNYAPVFEFLPITNVYTQHKIGLYQSVHDEEGDSLVYKLIAPKKSSSAFVNYLQNYGYDQPFGPSVNFSYNNYGQVNFTADDTGMIAVAYKIEEWGKDFWGKKYLKSEITRDMVTIVTKNTGQQPPQLTGINGTSSTTGYFSPYGERCFTINSFDPDKTDTISVSWNQGLKGATFDVEFNKKQPKGKFCWKAPGGPATVNSFIVSASDNGCPFKSTVQKKFTIINVGETIADAGKDEFLCLGDTVQLQAKGGDQYRWLPKEGLSDNAVSNPKAFPKTTTTYWLFAAKNFGNTALDSITIYVYGDCVWPGETNRKDVVDMKDILPIGIAYNQKGFKRANASDGWRAHYGVDWNTEFNKDINHKHQDCNGDGLVDHKDAEVVLKNYTKIPDTTNYFINGNITDPEFGIVFNKTNYKSGEKGTAKIYLGTDSLTAKDIYGFALRLKYDTFIIDTASLMVDQSSSWLVDENKDLIKTRHFTKKGLLDIGQCRIDHKAIEGKDKIANIHFKIKDNFPAEKLLQFSLLDAKVVNASHSDKQIRMAIPANQTFVNNKDDGNNGNDSTDNNNNNDDSVNKDSTINNNISISLFPNPAGKVLNISDPEKNIERIQLTNALGQILTDLHPATNLIHKINVETFVTGYYIIIIYKADERIAKPIIIYR